MSNSSSPPSSSFTITLGQAKELCPSLYKILQDSGLEQLTLFPHRHSKAYSKDLKLLFHINLKVSLDTPEDLLESFSIYTAKDESDT